MTMTSVIVFNSFPSEDEKAKADMKYKEWRQKADEYYKSVHHTNFATIKA